MEGSEWDPQAARVARESTGLPVHEAGAESLPLSLGPFDLIVLMHVLEHLADPAAALKRIAPLLAPDGCLVVIYPNPDSLLARRFGAHWVHWDPPRHLALFPPAGLSLLAQSAGLTLARRRSIARWAADTSALSRRAEEGTPVAGPLRHSRMDRAWAVMEGLMVGVGAPVGEEVVAVMQHRPLGAGKGSR